MKRSWELETSSKRLKSNSSEIWTRKTPCGERRCAQGNLRRSRGLSSIRKEWQKSSLRDRSNSKTSCYWMNMLEGWGKRSMTSTSRWERSKTRGKALCLNKRSTKSGGSSNPSSANSMTREETKEKWPKLPPIVPTSWMLGSRVKTQTQIHSWLVFKLTTREVLPAMLGSR